MITKLLAFFALLKVDTILSAKTAALSAAATGATVAQLAGTDPWIWVVSGIGAGVVYVKKESKSRLDAVTNAVISVALGGLLAPEVPGWAAQHFNIFFTTPYPIAFVVSASWPWAIPFFKSLMPRGNN
jgi:hypothetical protein